jgi:SRSO17 transposase
MVRDRVMQIIREEYDDPDSVGIFDETYHAKKGDKTPGVQRQWCGTKGTTDNCTVTVHLSLAAGEARCMVDSELFLPEETWSNNRERCQDAGIPDDVVYRPKWKIALELLDRATRNGVRFGWLTFDAGYGMHSEFMIALDGRGTLYRAASWSVIEVVEDSPHHPFEQPAGVKIAIEVDDVDAHYARVVQAGAEIVDPLGERPWGHRNFELLDPSGLHLVLFTPIDLAHPSASAR